MQKAVRIPASIFPVGLACLLWACAPASHARAALSWDSVEVTATPAPGADAVTAEFHFRNTGSTAVTIASVRPACGCTTATLKKMRFAPGEAGVLEVTFTIGDRTGPQRKTIEVQEAGAKTPDVLTLAVPLPEPMTVSPAALEWKIGEPSAAKDIQVSASPGVLLDRVESTSTEFEVKSDPAQHGGWTIRVHPSACDSPATALLRVHFSGKSSGTILVPLRIR